METAERKGEQKGRAEGLAEGREKGLAEGREKGLAEGRAEGEKNKAAEIAKRLKTQGMSDVEVSSLTGLSLDEVEAL